MKKRIISLLLALTLCAVPALAEEVAAEAPEASVETAVQPAAGPDEASFEEAAVTPDAEGTLSFENLERRIRENNLNLLTIQESVTALEELDYEKLEDTLRKNLAEIARAQRGMGQAASLPTDHPYYMPYDSYAAAQLEQGYASLRKQFDAVYEGELQEDNAGVIRQLKSLQDQIVMGGETLYLTIVDLEEQEGALIRQRDALDRTVAEMRLRYQMGQISALQLHQVESGRTTLESGLRTLQMNIRILKYQLEVMIGAELTGEIELLPVPTVTAEELSAMDLEKDYAAAKEISYEVYAADKAHEDAEEKYDEIWQRTRSDDLEYKQAVHDRAAAKYTHDAALVDYELRFRKLYHQVQDYAQILTAAETALEYEKGTYAVSELKFAQGTISENALKAAQDTLKTAEEKVSAAAGDLFASYNTYCWAVKNGILN